MVGQDQAKQERLLKLAAWLYHQHRFRTRAAGAPFTEVRFTRETLGQVSALDGYAPERGDAGEQALGRDTNALAMYGIDVRWDPVGKEWVSRASDLNDAECRALAIAALSVVVEDSSTSPTGFHVPGAGVSAEGAELIVAYAPIIDVLIEAIRSRTTVEIMHRGRSRIVDPWHVFMADGRWYVVGRDHDADDERVFALNVIDSVDARPGHRHYVIPPRNFAEIGRRVVDPDEWTSAEPIDVRIDVDARLVTRAEKLLGAALLSTDMTNGRVPMECTIRNVYAFIDRLWGLRGRAVVVGPPVIRQRVVSALEELL
ncbi:MAG: WYL domain-containing protein [Actinomycetia bacterium]|nr:WYL domain-containing protein [Actinomycetes bacterium]